MATTKRASKAKPAKRVDRRKTTSTRITPETRGRLDEAAAQSGRSLAQEIEFHLERALGGDEREKAALTLFGFDPKSYLAWRCLGIAISTIERQTGKSWREDWDTGQQIQAAFEAIVVAYGPKRPTENLLTPKGRARNEARKMKNAIAGKEAVISVLKAQMPGLKAMQRLLDEVRALEEAPDKENVET